MGCVNTLGYSGQRTDDSLVIVTKMENVDIRKGYILIAISSGHGGGQPRQSRKLFNAQLSRR